MCEYTCTCAAISIPDLIFLNVGDTYTLVLLVESSLIFCRVLINWFVSWLTLPHHGTSVALKRRSLHIIMQVNMCITPQCNICVSLKLQK